MLLFDLSNELSEEMVFVTDSLLLFPMITVLELLSIDGVGGWVAKSNSSC